MNVGPRPLAGSTVPAIALAGAVALVLGAGAVVVTRRRKAASPTGG
ncbi:LPXTG cell wall anchor domain-containing protein [Streptomyces sp. NPDC127084]